MNRQNYKTDSAPRLDDFNQGFTGKNLNHIVDIPASKWAEWLAKKNGGNVGPTQLRRFYQDIKAIEARSKGDSDFDSLRPLIKLLKSKTAYARGRKKVPQGFYDLIDKCVAKAQENEDEFRGFVMFFEALVGFHRMYKPKD